MRIRVRVFPFTVGAAVVRCEMDDSVVLSLFPLFISLWCPRLSAGCIFLSFFSGLGALVLLCGGAEGRGSGGGGGLALFSLSMFSYL